MATRTLDSPPNILPLYARAAAPLIPGASLLPFVPGHAREIPDLELTLAGVRANPDEVAAYRAGDEKAQKKKRGFFMGEAMKATKGSGNPQILNKLLDDRLKG